MTLRDLPAPIVQLAVAATVAIGAAMAVALPVAQDHRAKAVCETRPDRHPVAPWVNSGIDGMPRVVCMSATGTWTAP